MNITTKTEKILVPVEVKKYIFEFDEREALQFRDMIGGTNSDMIAANIVTHSNNRSKSLPADAKEFSSNLINVVCNNIP